MPQPELSPSTRRQFLALLGGLGAAAVLAGCGDDSNAGRARGTVGSSGTTATTGGQTSGTQGSTALTSCSKIPTETAGPYPGDGSNGPNVLGQGGVVRQDIRTSLSGAGVARGLPLTVDLTVVDANGCQPRSGAAVYLWHCSADGLYSMYSPGATNETYLRGVQAADSSGLVRFTTVFPGAYTGRYPHIHFEIYPSVNAATSAQGRLGTSQLALPADACRAVYATSGYGNSASNFAQTPIERDMVFSDGYSLQMATITGNASSGYAAKLVVAV